MDHAQVLREGINQLPNVGSMSQSPAGWERESTCQRRDRFPSEDLLEVISVPCRGRCPTTELVEGNQCPTIGMGPGINIPMLRSMPQFRIGRGESMPQYQDQWQLIIYYDGYDSQCPNVRSMMNGRGFMSQRRPHLANMEDNRVPICACRLP